MKSRKKEIMELIKKEKIKMKPRWIFDSRRWGKRLLFGTGIVAGSVLIALVDFLMSLRRAKEYLNYGEVGREIFWEKMPVGESILGLMFIGMAMIFFEKIGDNYKMNRWTRIGISLALAGSSSLIVRLVMKRFELELGLSFI